MHVPSLIVISTWFHLGSHLYPNLQVCSQKAIAIGDVPIHLAGKDTHLRDYPSLASLSFLVLVYAWRTIL